MPVLYPHGAHAWSNARCSKDLTSPLGPNSLARAGLSGVGYRTSRGPGVSSAQTQPCDIDLPDAPLKCQRTSCRKESRASPSLTPASSCSSLRSQPPTPISQGDSQTHSQPTGFSTDQPQRPPWQREACLPLVPTPSSASRPSLIARGPASAKVALASLTHVHQEPNRDLSTPVPTSRRVTRQ